MDTDECMCGRLRIQISTVVYARVWVSVFGSHYLLDLGTSVLAEAAYCAQREVALLKWRSVYLLVTAGL